jgi:hypothetical protein
MDDCWRVRGYREIETLFLWKEEDSTTKVSRTREAAAESWWRPQFILKAPVSQSYESNAKEMIEWTVNKPQFVTFLSFVATYRV